MKPALQLRSPLPLHLLLLLLPQGSCSPHTYGCLFEERLCSHEELCVNDGLFGQCQDAMMPTRTQYDISAALLQRLQGVLKQLMLQGLSWQDDITQYVISMEMEKVPKLLPQQQRLSTVPLADGRLQWPVGRGVYPVGVSMSSVDQWPPSLIRRYLQFILYGNPPRLHPEASLEGELLETYLLPKFGYRDSPMEAIAENTRPLPADTPPSRRHSEPLRIRRQVPMMPESSWSGPAAPSRQEWDWRQLRDLMASYLFEQSGSVLQPSVEQERNHHWRVDHLKARAGEHPADYASTYDLSYGEMQDANQKHLNRMKGQSTGPSDPRPQGETAAQRIAMELGKYGIDLRDLSEQQLNSVSTAILQLPKTGGRPETAPVERNGPIQKKASMMEGTMQHWKEVESRESSESQITDPHGARPSNPSGLAAAGGQGAVRRWWRPLWRAPVRGRRRAARGSRRRPWRWASRGRTWPRSWRTLTWTLSHCQSTARSSSRIGAQRVPACYIKRSTPTSSPIKVRTAFIQQLFYPQGLLPVSSLRLSPLVPLTLSDGIKLLESLAQQIHLATVSFINISVIGPALTFRVRQNDQNLTIAEVTNKAIADKTILEAETGLKIVQAGVGERNAFHSLPKPARHSNTFRFLLLSFIAVACIAGILIAGAVIFCLRQNAKQRQKEKLAGLGPEGGTDTSLQYQELCRQHMAAKSSYARTETVDTSRVSSVSSQFSDAPQASPSSHSSTPSWCEEPVQSNMDISTGHMILAYMEDHLKTKDRLHKEWEALCAYQAEPNSCSIGQSEANIKKSRNPDFVPYDHNRMILKAEANPSRTDFINASPIIDHDPRMPAYIATQGPLSHTISDFWQMVWENGCTVIVMLTPLVEDSIKHCDRYWPDEGSSLYHIYEVNLVSEHIWCEDFLVRSFYLKNLQSQETRTLTQFHFLSWPAEGIPSSTRPLLDFRRKVNKCYRGRSCPIIVHCSDGAGRTGTYTLIDMVLNRMSKGVKEIDIAATLEHIRDQRPGMVRTKDQFEFALTAVAEEVNAILKALPQ
ncbi:receptor-type tyrosine-protein phosphatase-like N [Mustelus asterias]